MRWEVYLQRREQRRARALSAAAALEVGDSAAAAALLDTWSLDAGDAELLVQRLMAGSPKPSSRQTTALLADPALLPAPERGQVDVAEHLHRRRLAAHAPPGDHPALAWALDELSFLGDEVDRRQRRAWQDRPWRSEPDADATAGALWSGFFSGDAWSAGPIVQQHHLPAAVGCFRDELLTRGLPAGVAQARAQELEGSFFYHLVMGPEGGAPGWLELAARVVETSAEEPAAALLSRLDAGGQDIVARCVAARGGWARTAALRWPGRRGAGGRALVLREALGHSGAVLLRGLDLHVASRLVSTWCSGQAGATDPDRSWRVVAANRGRARGRLRAARLARGGRGLLDQLLALPALGARTRAAVGWYARDWARAEIESGFAFNESEPLTAPCSELPTGLEPLDEREVAMARTWVVLVVLRGHGARLERWTRLGSTGDRDSAWGRLLAEALPRDLRDPGTAGRSGYERLRAWLAIGLGEALDEQRDLIDRIARLDPSTRGLPKRLATVVGDDWHEHVPLPRRGVGELITTARALLEAP